jgi:hypothetical protein
MNFSVETPDDDDDESTSWPFDEIDPSPDHKAFYNALDEMDQSLILLSEEHQQDMETLQADFFAQMETIMQKYRQAIDYDIKNTYMPWKIDGKEEQK